MLCAMGQWLWPLAGYGFAGVPAPTGRTMVDITDVGACVPCASNDADGKSSPARPMNDLAKGPVQGFFFAAISFSELSSTSAS
jgi:hypothetical protein